MTFNERRAGRFGLPSGGGCTQDGIVSFQDAGNPLALNGCESPETLEEWRPAARKLPGKQAILFQIRVRRQSSGGP